MNHLLVYKCLCQKFGFHDDQLGLLQSLLPRICGFSIVMRKGSVCIYIHTYDIYLTEANNQLSNTTFYQKLNNDPSKDYAKLITNSLKEMKNEQLIDDELFNALVPNNSKTAKLYLLPKIHKNNNPGRPVVFSINCNTSKISKYVDHHIQPLAKQVKSYIKDTTNFINKLQKLTQIPNNAILVTMDVRSLYTNISHTEGIEALKESLDTRPTKEPSTETIATLMNHVLTLNNFTFNGENFLQVKGCAIGTIAAPSYATIFMGNFEET